MTKYNNQSPLVFFDGVCNFCCGWVQFILKWDKKSNIKFVSIQSEMGSQLLAEYGINPTVIETVYYLKHNQMYNKSNAVLELAKDLGGVWKVFYVFKIIPLSIRNYLYRQIANSRYKLFGVRNACFMPSAEQRNRFLH